MLGVGVRSYKGFDVNDCIICFAYVRTLFFLDELPKQVPIGVNLSVWPTEEIIPKVTPQGSLYKTLITR